jgi:peroxiredoxin family protein
MQPPKKELNNISEKYSLENNQPSKNQFGKNQDSEIDVENLPSVNLESKLRIELIVYKLKLIDKMIDKTIKKEFGKEMPELSEKVKEKMFKLAACHNSMFVNTKKL